MDDAVVRSRRIAPPSERIAPKKFAHFVLKTARFEEVIEWYRTVLQARIVSRNGMLCFLSYDEEHHRLAIANMPQAVAAPSGSAGVDHVAYTYAGLGELLATYRRLKAAGIEPVWCINHGPTTSMYYRDPDGLRVELQIDNFATDAELNDYFTSADFQQNPVGVTYDPDELARRYEAGAPLEELLRRPPLPEGKTPLDMLRL
jgi:catechol 2,3-dioxygenase-like lactoylglutathione lyase family enzyme